MFAVEQPADKQPPKAMANNINRFIRMKELYRKPHRNQARVENSNRNIAPTK